MRKINWVAVLLAIGMALPHWVAAQNAVTEQQATAPPQASSVLTDQQPSKEQLEKLFEVMRLREQLQDYFTKSDALAQKQAMAQFNEVFTKMCDGCTLTPGQHTAIDNMMSTYAAKLIGIYTVDERIDNICAIYKRHLSRSDVDALVVFYGSPAGQHLLDEKPAIMQEYVTDYMNRMQERSKSIVDEMAEEMQKVIKSPVTAKDKPAKK